MFQAEIIPGDPLYELIVRLVKEYKPNSILEIGSGNGLGSTGAFLEGLSHTVPVIIPDRNRPIMCCIEANPERFDELVKNTKEFTIAKIKCINGSATPVSQYMSEDDIEKFMKEHGYRFNIKRYSVDTVKKWRYKEIDMIEKIYFGRENPVINQGAFYDAYIEIGKKPFDMALIDGSAFTGIFDYDLCYDSKVIIMDDTMDIKCWEPMCRILKDEMYELIARDDNHRNGYAAFRRKT